MSPPERKSGKVHEKFTDAPRPAVADLEHLGIKGNGLVLTLGAGGATGLAYTAGALWAIEEVTGLDLREAPDLVVGTSAGSIASAYLRHGWTPHELALMEPPEFTSPDPQRRRLLIPHDENAFLRMRRLVGTGIDLVHHTRKKPRANPLSERFSSLFPSGLFSITDSDWDHQQMPREWPERPLWVVTADLDRFERVVLRKPLTEDETIDLRTALQASMALPGVWSPVRAAGRRLYDGGMTDSTTHIDLALRGEAACVIAVAPFGIDPVEAAESGVPRARRGVMLQAAREMAELERNGVSAMVLGPTRHEIAAAGRNMLDRSRTTEVAHAAFDATMHRLARPEVREFLDHVLEVVG